MAQTVEMLTRPDRVIFELARRQHGVVARRRLIRAGLTRQHIATRLADRRLSAVYRGVYQVGPVLTTLGRLQAALLCCGPGAVLSHVSAALLWKLGDRLREHQIWITVPPGRSARRSGLHIVRAKLPEQDVRRHLGLPVTSPPRTVLDCSQLTDSTGLEWMLSEANFRRYARDGEIFAQLDRNVGKRGNALLRQVMGLDGGPQRTRSDGEIAFLALLRDAGIQGFEVNGTIHGEEVDFLWRDLRFGVELDGWDGHSGREAFERDRLKWAKLQADGVAIMPVTGRQIRDDTDGVLGRLLAVLHDASSRAPRGAQLHE